jgi:hypothetical protein
MAARWCAEEEGTMAVVAGVGRVRARLAGGTLLWPTVGVGVLWQIGGHVDAWYHMRYGFAVETFFTWPHALLYAAWAAIGALGMVGVAQEHRRGARLGYGLVLLGAVLFGLGGAADLAWHSLFGFEVRLETLWAPSHLWLLVAFAVSAVGVLQATLDARARAGTGRAADLAVVVALALVFRVLFWNLWYTEPLAADYASHGALSRHLPGLNPMGWDTQAAEAAGTSGIVLHSVLLAAFLVAILQRLKPAAGAIAAVLLWNGLLTMVVADKLLYLPAVVGAALVGEAIWARMGAGALGGAGGRLGYWALGAAVPTAQFAGYFALMAAAGGGVAWTTHLWAGTPLVAGFYGLMAALVVAPPPGLAGADERVNARTG